MILTAIGIGIITVLYLLIGTPYPFVWLLRSRKEEKKEKAPQHIETIKEEVSICLSNAYPSVYKKATYDSYMPKTKERKGIIVWIHGGSFISGSSEGTKNYASMMAYAGYGVCSMNYETAPEKSFPHQLMQIDDMLNHITEKYPDTALFLGGDSAGANLAAEYAALRTNQELERKIKKKVKNNTKIMGLLLFCGPYDFCEDMKNPAFKGFEKFMKYIGWAYLGKKNWMKREEKYLASPIHHIRSNYPPVYLCDGKKYSFLWQGRKLEEKLKHEKVYVKTRFYEEMSHEFQFDYKANPKQAMQVYEDSLQFLEVILETERKEC